MPRRPSMKDEKRSYVLIMALNWPLTVPAERRLDFESPKLLLASIHQSNVDSRMTGLRCRISGPLSTSTTGTTDRATPINPNKVPAQPNPKFVKRAVDERGRRPLMMFRPSEVAESAEAAYLSYASVKKLIPAISIENIPAPVHPMPSVGTIQWTEPWPTLPQPYQNKPLAKRRLPGIEV